MATKAQVDLVTSLLAQHRAPAFQICRNFRWDDTGRVEDWVATLSNSYAGELIEELLCIGRQAQ